MQKNDLKEIHTTRVRVDLPVAVEGAATEEEVHDDDQVAYTYQGVPDVDADFVISANASLGIKSGFMQTHSQYPDIPSIVCKTPAMKL